MPNTMFRAAIAASAFAMVPAATGAMAEVDANNFAEINRFMTVMNTVKAAYVEPVSDKKLIDGAIRGMLEGLDPHSGYLDEHDTENLRTQTDGKYGGLGLTVVQEDGAVKVIAPFEDSPANRAGIKAGDYITHLDGKLIVGGELDDAVDTMRGEPGTQIKLTIVRPGRTEPFDVTLTREIVELKPVKWDVKDNVGIININSFSRTTMDGVREAIAEIDKKLGHKPAGYIIDLRSNPGGLLDQAIEVSDAFLERGEVVSQRGRAKGDIERYYAKPGDLTGGLPLIVLIDAGSASASEIVAGALQDHHRAIVMGERSFGKGSVQSIIDLSKSTQLRITTARYFTPSGRSVQEGGIKPDIAVPQLSDPDYKKRPRFREADLQRHLVNENLKDDTAIEADVKDDPRFNMTSDQLKAKGVTDFQLTYAIETIMRLDTRTASARGGKTGGRR